MNDRAPTPRPEGASNDPDSVPVAALLRLRDELRESQAYYEQRAEARPDLDRYQHLAVETKLFADKLDQLLTEIGGGTDEEQTE